MRGHIRRRGDPGSWEYIIDVGMAAAQRCQSCGHRFWMERKAQALLPEVRRDAARDARNVAARRRPVLPAARTPRRPCARSWRRSRSAATWCHRGSPCGSTCSRSGCRQSKAPCDRPRSPATPPTSRATSCRRWDRCSSHVSPPKRSTPSMPNCWRTVACKARAPSPPPPCVACMRPCIGLSRMPCAGTSLPQSGRCRRSPERSEQSSGSCRPGTQNSWPAFCARCATIGSSPSGGCWR